VWKALQLYAFFLGFRQIIEMTPAPDIAVAKPSQALRKASFTASSSSTLAREIRNDVGMMSTKKGCRKVKSLKVQSPEK